MPTPTLVLASFETSPSHWETLLIRKWKFCKRVNGANWPISHLSKNPFAIILSSILIMRFTYSVRFLYLIISLRLIILNYSNNYFQIFFRRLCRRKNDRLSGQNGRNLHRRKYLDKRWAVTV